MIQLLGGNYSFLPLNSYSNDSSQPLIPVASVETGASQWRVERSFVGTSCYHEKNLLMNFSVKATCH